MGSGDKILSSDFSSLFTRLESLRQLHQSAVGQTNGSAFSTAFANPIATNNKIQINDVTQLNNDLSQLKQSTWYQSDTTSTTTTLGTQFPSNFEVPSVGELITAAKFNTLTSQMNTLEGICPVYSGQYSNAYSNAYSNRYSQYSSRYSQYSSRYSQYSSRYAQYSSRYGTRYGTRYDTRYSQYSSRYSQYSSRYSQYSGRYSGRYGTRYSQYSGRYSRYENKGRW